MAARRRCFAQCLRPNAGRKGEFSWPSVDAPVFTPSAGEARCLQGPSRRYGLRFARPCGVVGPRFVIIRAESEVGGRAVGGATVEPMHRPVPISPKSLGRRRS